MYVSTPFSVCDQLNKTVVQQSWAVDFGGGDSLDVYNIIIDVKGMCWLVSWHLDFR